MLYMLLTIAGFGVGILSGLFGVGGGIVTVPLLVALGYSPIHAIATSSFSVVMSSLSASIRNYAHGGFRISAILSLAWPAILSAQLGVWIAARINGSVLIFLFACLTLISAYLVNVRERTQRLQGASMPSNTSKLHLRRWATGGAAGFLSGMFGVGGGIVLVPMQMMLLGESIKVAVQVSLAVIVLSSLSTCLTHAYNGNLLLPEGLCLGLGALIGSQVGAWLLHKCPELWVKRGFNTLLLILAGYMFWQAIIAAS